MVDGVARRLPIRKRGPSSRPRALWRLVDGVSGPSPLFPIKTLQHLYPAIEHFLARNLKVAPGSPGTMAANKYVIRV